MLYRKMWHLLESDRLTLGLQYHYSYRKIKINVITLRMHLPRLVTVTLCHIPSDTVVFDIIITAPKPRLNLTRKQRLILL